MAAPHNVELEAAKFLHKLIQESKDEPRKLATKLYVILQHMRSSGKENSMPYQVISRAMETVINEHGLDIEALTSSRPPLAGGTHIGDSSSTQFAGSSQTAAIAKDSKSGMAENEMANSHASSRPPVGPSGAGHDIYQGSVSHLSAKSLDHESPSSHDTRSANSQSQDRHDAAWEKANQNDSKKANSKRKRADSSSTIEPRVDNSQQLDNSNLSVGKGKLTAPSSLSVRGSEHGQFNMVQGSGQIEHVPSLPNSMRTTNITNSMQRAANSKYREEIEVSSAHSALGLQQGGTRLSPHDILSSRGVWNQNRLGSSLENTQLPRFPSNAGSGNSTTEIFMQQSTASLGSGAPTGASGSYPPVEPGISSPMHFGGASREAFSASPLVEPCSGKATVDSEYWKHGFTKGAVTNYSERTGEAQFFSDNRRELVSSSLSTGKALEHEVGTSNVSANANRIVQSGIPGNNSEMNMLRGGNPRDAGKSPSFQAAGASNMPFKEQHLKQLRAQCLVFLAFRNRMIPKKLHLDIALGNFIPKEDGPSKELIDHKGKELSINDQSNIPEGTMLFGRLNDARETEIVRQGSTSTGLLLEANLLKESKDPNMIQEIAESQAILAMGSQPDSLSARHLAVSYGKDDLEKGQAGIENQAASVIGVSKEMKPEMVSWTGIASHNEAAKGSVPGSMVPQESVPERKDIAPFQSQIPADSNIQRSRHAESHLTSFPSRDHWKPFSGMEAEHQRMELAKNVSEGSKSMSEDDQTISEIQRRSIPYGFKTVVDDMRRNGSPTVVETDQEEQDISLCTDLPPAPKYTTSEKWIMEQQKRKLVLEQDWALKQKNTEQRIAACSQKLKANVSSSEDISAKTKSVIELKKLQLLELQRRLRSDILNDFFKPISTEMERLKSVKKNRIGRRSKQIERFEQKMKEERQKRIRERQKEFFSEIEVHKERLDDVFKMKRERWKGFNKYVREFHKRKERIHREKIDRIQREKINLLKINDVEGYLRMVQDAKSDRVKQLLKETEKYLQKLGSKLRDAKATARHYETDIEEDRAASVFESNEIDVENEDEADQAKHYLESNEKYYLMAHSIKESIMEQPTCLQGGKLREYQMNGLRWLVSLYNNHLNGILADEMGLGKTVQVISLICYLMETKNDRGPFLVVVPSSVLPGWESEINFWAPSINSIVYSGPPEERRRLFKERIVQQKFNVLLTTYEYLMNKHDRPKLSKLQWHYIIIDEGHRIKNASCKLNADLKHYHSSHRLLLTGTPLQNNLEELWALLNFLLPNIFNSSEDFSQWFNKPFESNGDNSADQALLSEEENLLIINRLHQVLRPFVLRRLKHKVESQLPEKIERLVRCEASSYQKLLMKRVEDNLGAIGSSKARTVHNSVMELRNICNHPYLSQLHVEEVHDFVPKHYLPNFVRICGKLEMLDRLLPKLKATDHRVLFFSTMTRLLDVMEDYLCWKQYRYLRLDGHTSGGDRGALIDQFNQPGSPFFIFLLSIRAGGVGVNLQAADTVIIFDTDWNPQVDLQAQARAHRIGQKKDVLVLRLETVQTVEEQVRAAAEHKLGVANQSITAGFFDNNTSAEDRREYLESLLRECKKEEAAPVLDDDSLNDLIARSESEIDIFEAVDRQRLEEEMAMWKDLLIGHGKNVSEPIPPLPSRLLTDDELKPFYEAIKTYEVSNARVPSNVGEKRKRGGLGGLDTQHYGRGKRAREVRSYEEQWTEEEFEKICQADSPDSPKLKEEVVERISPIVASGSIFTAKTELPVPLPAVSPQPPAEPPIQQIKEVTPPAKRGRGRPKRATVEISQPAKVLPAPSGASKTELASQSVIVSSFPAAPVPDSLPSSATVQSVTGAIHQFGVYIAPSSESVHPLPSVTPGGESTPTPPSVALQVKGQARKTRGGTEAPRRRGKNQASLPPVVQVFPAPSGAGKGAGIADTIAQRETVSNFPTASFADSTSNSSTLKDMSNEQGKVSHAVLVVPASTESVRTETESEVQPVAHAIPLLPPSTGTVRTESVSEVVSVSHAIPVLPASTETVRTGSGSELRPVSSYPMVPVPDSLPATSVVTGTSGTMQHFGLGIAPSSQPNPPFAYVALGSQSISPSPPVAKQTKGRGRKPQTGVEAPLRRGRRRGPVAPVAADGLVCEDLKLNEQPQSKLQVSPGRKSIGTRRKRGNEAMEAANVVQVQASEVQTSDDLAGSEAKPTGQSDCFAPNKHPKGFSTESDSSAIASEKTDCQKMDAKSQEVKVPLPEEAIVSESKVAESKSVEEKKVISTLETAAAVIDRELQKSKKDVSVGRQERNDHILQEAVVSNTAVCERDTKLDSGSLLHVADSRDLGKETLIVKTSMEGTSVVPLSAEPLVDVTCEKPPAPDASVSETAPSILDLGMDKCEDQSGKEDSTEQQMEGPGLDNVVVSKPVETKSLEEKNFSTSSTVETDAPVVDPETDKTEKEVHGEAQEMNDAIFQEAVDSTREARETETKINAGSFENAEDLVTENSIVGTSVEGTSAVPPNSDSSDDVPCKRSSAPDASVLALTVDACEDRSGKEDAKEQDMKCSVRDDAVVSEPWEDKGLGKKEFSTVPRLEPASPVDTGIEKTRMEVDAEALGSCDPILQEAVVSNAEARESETKLNAGPPENVADPRDLVNENSLEETNVDGTSAMALDAEPLDNLLCEEPPAPDVLVLESAASVSDISMDREDQSGKEDGKEQGMKVPVQDDVVVAGPREINNLEGEKFSTSSTSEKEAPVDPEKIETNFGKEAEESNDPSLQEAVISLPEASEPETKINASSFENVTEPTDLVEEKTIVGSKVEGTSEQDLKRLVEDDAVVPETDESKSLEENCVSTFSRLHPTTPVVDTEIGKTVKDVDAEALQSYDSTLQDAVVSEPMACELETKLNASPQNLADSSDFVTENSLLESNAESSPATTLNADPLDNVPCEEPPAPDALVLEPTGSASDISMYCEGQSGREDVKEQEEQGMKGPDDGNVVVTETRETNNLEGEKFLTLSTSEKAAPVDSEIEKIEKNFDAEAQESSDLILQEALVSTPEVSEPAMKNNTSSLENGADLMDIAEENSIVGTNVEGASAVLDNVEPSDDMPCVEPPPPDVSPLDLITDKGEDHGKEDMKEQKLEGPFLDPAVVPELGVDEIKSLEEKNLTTVSTLEQAAPDVEEETEKTNKKVDGEAQESNNSSLLEAVVSKFEGCEPETIVEAGCSKNVANPIDVAKENIIVETIVEGTSSEGCDPETKLEAGCSENVADPIDAGKENSVVETIVESTSTNASENVPCEKPPTPEALVLEAADSVPDITMGECGDQSGKEDMVLDKGNVSESAAIENQSDERTSSNFEIGSPIGDPPREMPETHLIPGSSENMEDSEPIVEERKDMVLDKGTVSESAAIEAGSSENMEDSEPIVEERKDMVLDTGTVSESAAIENQCEERTSSNFDTASPIVDPPCGKPETQLNAGSSEKMGDSEPIVEERKDTVVDKGLVSEPVVTENQSSEEKMSTLETNSPVVDSPHEKPETLLDAGSSENVEDSEPTVGERKDTVVDEGLVSEPVVTENQSMEEKMSTLETNSPVVNQTVEDSEQPGEENTVMGTNMEVDPAVPPNPISNDDVPQEEPLVSDASLHSSSLGGYSNILFDSALATEGAKESSSATERKSSEDK